MDVPLEGTDKNPSVLKPELVEHQLYHITLSQGSRMVLGFLIFYSRPGEVGFAAQCSAFASSIAQPG